MALRREDEGSFREECFLLCSFCKGPQMVLSMGLVMVQLWCRELETHTQHMDR